MQIFIVGGFKAAKDLMKMKFEEGPKESDKLIQPDSPNVP